MKKFISPRRIKIPISSFYSGRRNTVQQVESLMSNHGEPRCSIAYIQLDEESIPECSVQTESKEKVTQPVQKTSEGINIKWFKLLSFLFLAVTLTTLVIITTILLIQKESNGNDQRMLQLFLTRNDSSLDLEIFYLEKIDQRNLTQEEPRKILHQDSLFLKPGTKIQVECKGYNFSMGDEIQASYTTKNGSEINLGETKTMRNDAHAEMEETNRKLLQVKGNVVVSKDIVAFSCSRKTKHSSQLIQQTLSTSL